MNIHCKSSLRTGCFARNELDQAVAVFTRQFALRISQEVTQKRIKALQIYTIDNVLTK